MRSVELVTGDYFRALGLVPAAGRLIAAQAQLLRYAASVVRPQGRTAGGMAGIKLAAGDEAISFGVTAAEDPDAVVVTIATGAETLTGTAAGTVKVTPLSEYPAKGRATGGVRAHRFLKGEEKLTLAWAGHGPAKAASAAGVARALPTEHGRRDGSGVPLAQSVAAIGPALGAPALPAAPSAAPKASAPQAARVAPDPETEAKPFSLAADTTSGDGTLFD